MLKLFNKNDLQMALITELQSRHPMIGNIVTVLKVDRPEYADWATEFYDQFTIFMGSKHYVPFDYTIFVILFLLEMIDSGDFDELA